MVTGQCVNTLKRACHKRQALIDRATLTEMVFPTGLVGRPV